LNSRSFYFSFNDYADSLAEFIKGKEPNNSFVTAITGNWGCGKTTLMDLTLNRLGDNEYIKVPFNAWRYTKEDAVWRGFFINIISALRKHLLNSDMITYIGWEDNDVETCKGIIDNVEKSLYTAFIKESPGEVSVDTGNLAKTGLKLALKFVPWSDFGVDWIERLFSKKDNNENINEKTIDDKDIENLWGIFRRSVVKRSVEKISSMEQFRLSIEKLLCAVLKGDYKDEFTGQKIRPIMKPLKLIVAIDDLDRCLPEQALEILEAIKLFMDLPGTFFLVAIDSEIVQYGLDLRYKQMEIGRPQIRSKQYTEKMIDLSFSIPSVLEANFIKYITSELPNGKELHSIYDTLKIALQNNLRSWERYSIKAEFNKKVIESLTKRFDNTRNLFEDGNILKVFFKLQCLAYQWPDVFRKIDNIRTYFELERCLQQVPESYYSKDSYGMKPQLGSVSDTNKVPINVWDEMNDIRLVKYIKSDPLVKEINNLDDLNIFFSLDIDK